MWIIGTVVTVGAALAGFMYALVDHDRLEERLRAVGA